MGDRRVSAREGAGATLTPVVTAVCRLLLAAIFLTAAVGKLAQPKAFLRAVLEYQMLPPALAPWVAAMLPGVEFLAGAVLLTAAFQGRRREVWAVAAAWIVAGLLAFFTAALTVNLLRGVPMNCGCFDILGEHLPYFKPTKATWATVGRDLLMLLPALPLLRARR